MDGARTHTFRIAVAAIAFFAAGFLIGFCGVCLWGAAGKAKKPNSQIAANTIMTKRMGAINRARKNGRTEYEFTFVSPVPILGKQ